MVKTLSVESVKKASQKNKERVSKCPENLDYLIQMANEFPSDVKTLNEICGGDYEKNWRSATAWIFEYLSNSPKCLEYVKGESPISDSSDAVLPHTPRFYKSLRESIFKLQELAQISTQISIYRAEILRATPSTSSQISNQTSIYPPYILEKFNGTVFCIIDENGNMTFKSEDVFTRVMQNVAPFRVRSCEICGKVFWAKKVGEKSDSRACSPPHATNLRKRKSYEKNKENRIKNRDEINKNRRELRRQEKDRKLKIEESKKREEGNGNL